MFRNLLTVVLIALPILATPCASPAADRPPNFVIIVADDLGYADLGVQGCRDIPTPNIDTLAAGGVRFTNGYVSCPVCSPTRAGLQTGRYQQRFGHELNPGPEHNAAPNFGLPLTEVTLADRLKKAGYATGLVGKWHLGYRPEFHPLQRGYDEFFGFLAGHHDYFKSDEPGPLMRGTKPIQEPQYLTEAFGREAASFIDRHREKPFLLMLTFNAIHQPMEATDQHLQRFTAIDDPLRRKTAAMLSAMDDAVGIVLNKLRTAKLEENTLIFFVSDNGGPTAVNGSRNTPLRGFKAQVWEGGIRVPFLVQWKGVLPAGRVYDKPVISLDIHPTCLAAAGGKFEIDTSRPLDGVNLLPYLKSENTAPPHDALFWRYGNQAAARVGNYKLVRQKADLSLYDLASDISEQNDLAKEKPEVLSRAKEALEKWESQMIPPAWTQGAHTPPPGRRAAPPGRQGDAPQGNAGPSQDTEQRPRQRQRARRNPGQNRARTGSAPS